MEGADGEQITVEVRSSGTKHLVKFALNGMSGSSPCDDDISQIAFVLEKASHDPCILTIMFAFSDEGGNYAVTVSGSDEGQVSHFSVTQFFGIPGEAIGYTFDVL